MIGALEIRVVEPGSIQMCPETGAELVVDDTRAVVDERNGIAWVTQRTYDAIKCLAPTQSEIAHISGGEAA